MSKKHSSKFLCSRMMLPEHAAALREHEKVKEEKLVYGMPDYDEQQMEEWESLLQRSMSEGKEVEITYMDSRGPIAVKGVVVETNQFAGYFFLSNENKRVKIFYRNIMGVVP